MDQKRRQMPATAAEMTKRCPLPKMPPGRPPAGAVLIDGKWHTTQQSIQIAVERLLQQRERVRNRRDATGEMLRRERPELFVHVRTPADPTQTTLSAARSDKPNSTLEQYQKKD